MSRPLRRHPGQGMVCLQVVLASMVLLARNDGNGTPMALLQTLFISHELLSDRAWIGLGASTPYGLKTSWTPGWVGRYHAIDSELITVNVNPSLALKLTRWLSIGGGADID